MRRFLGVLCLITGLGLGYFIAVHKNYTEQDRTDREKISLVVLALIAASVWCFGSGAVKDPK